MTRDEQRTLVGLVSYLAGYIEGAALLGEESRSFAVLQDRCGEQLALAIDVLIKAEVEE